MAVIAIIGAAGFVGVNLALRALELNHSVILVDVADRFDRLALNDLSAKPTARTIQVDARDLPASALAEADVIYHLAALPHVQYSMYEPAEAVANNTLALLAVLEAARTGAIPLIYTSSIEVYGGNDGERFGEDAAMNPLSPYAGSKAAGELILRSYRQAFGLAATTARLTNLYGPWQLPDRLAPRVCAQLLSGIRPQLDGDRYRDLLHVTDAVDALLTIFEAQAWGEVFNIASGRSISTRRVASAIAQTIGVEDAFDLSDPTGDGRGFHLVSSPERIGRILGWTARTPLEEGLATTVDWYRDHRGWWERFLPILAEDRSTPRFMADYRTWTARRPP
jgi:dTDP-glucose 4,6-dehydratase